MKPFKSYDEQIEILKDRGMIFRDESKALHVLEREITILLLVVQTPKSLPELNHRIK